MPSPRHHLVNNLLSSLNYAAYDSKNLKRGSAHLLTPTTSLLAPDQRCSTYSNRSRQCQCLESASGWHQGARYDESVGWCECMPTQCT